MNQSTLSFTTVTLTKYYYMHLELVHNVYNYMYNYMLSVVFAYDILANNKT